MQSYKTYIWLYLTGASLRPHRWPRCAGQSNQTIYATVVSDTNMQTPAINGTVTVRARSTSDRANGLPGTLLGTVVINNCSTASYPGAPSNGCFGKIPLPATLSADTYLFTASYSGTQPPHPLLGSATPFPLTACLLP